MKKVVVSKTNIRKVRKRKKSSNFTPYLFLIGTFIVGIALCLLYLFLRDKGTEL